MKKLMTVTMLGLSLTMQVHAQEEKSTKREKRKELVAKVARGAGLGATVVTRTLLKQFVFASSWVRGLVGKRRNQEASLALLDILLRDENLQRFDAITKSSTTWEEYMSDMQDEVETILEDYVDETLVSVLHDVDGSISKDAKLEDIDFLSLDLTKMTPELLASNEDYRRLEAMIGEMDEQRVLDDLFSKGELNLMSGNTTEKDVEAKIQERVNLLSTKIVDNIDVGAAVVGQTVITPLLIKGVFGKAAMQAFNWITLPALAGTGISAWQCLRAPTQIKIATDAADADANTQGLQKFCNKVLNTSAYQLLKARSKGLQSGNHTKVWVERTWNKAFKKKKK